MILPLHGLGSRQDLPLPFELVLLGAALALLLSFGALVLAWRRPRYTVAGGLALPGLTRVVDAPVTRAVLRLLALALYGWMALALWFGQDRVTNPIFGFVFVWLWVGLVPLSLMLGSIWRVTNPLATLARLALAPSGALRPLSEAAWKRIGIVPGVITLLGFAWLELVQPDNNTLPVLRWFPDTFLGRKFIFGLSDQIGPFWLQVLIVLLLTSFFSYWVHRWQHTSDFWWKLHGYHHGVTSLQISNVLVSNPLEWAMRNILGGLFLSLVGFNPIAVVIAGGLNIYGDFSHCGADLKGGWLNYVFNTPEVHRWHHSTEFPDDPKFRYGCNYGVGVSFWDQLFGTFYLPKDEKGAVISPKQLGHPEGYADEPNYLKMMIGLRAFPALERWVERKKDNLSSVPAE